MILVGSYHEPIPGYIESVIDTVAVVIFSLAVWWMNLWPYYVKPICSSR